MKTFIKLFTLVWLMMPIQLYGQVKSTVTYKDAVALFMRSEMKLIQHREYVFKKRIFEDPVGNDQIVFNTIRKESPDLYESTYRYKDYLLRMLTDSTLKKNEFMDRYIITVLYNLCIDEYVDVMVHVYILFKNKQIPHRVFDNTIIQDFNMSTQVARNYKNEKLQSFLLRLQKDTVLMDRLGNKKLYFKAYIQDLISGKEWETNLKEWEANSKKTVKIQPPYLKQSNCK